MVKKNTFKAIGIIRLKMFTSKFFFLKYYFATKLLLLQVEDDFRGCSPFILQGATDEEEQICNVAQLDGLSHRNCKHSCTDDKCNKNILTRGHSCYTCTGTRDAAGNPVGNSDDRCFFSLNERLFRIEYYILEPNHYFLTNFEKKIISQNVDPCRFVLLRVFFY